MRDLSEVTDSLKSLRQRKAELLTEQERLLATAASEQRALTDEERRRSDELFAAAESISDTLRRYERYRGLTQPDDPQLGEGNERRALDSLLPEDERVLAAFGGDPRCGYRSIAEFAREVRSACVPGAAPSARLVRLVGAYREAFREPRAQPANYLQETGGTAGEGFYVPPAFRQEVWDLVFTDEQAGNLLEAVNPEPTTSNTVEMQADETTPWGSTGIQASWRAEGTKMTASKIDEKMRQVRLHELFAFVLATEELLADGPRLAARLTRGAARAIRFKASDAIMNGTGAGQPLGWLNSPALVTQAAESGQAADTVVAQNVAKMFARMLPSGLGDARWYINSDVLPQLLTMQLGNNAVYALPQVGFVQAPGGFLFGRPVIPVEHCATVGDVGDIQFVSPSGYYAAVRAGEGLQFASSMHLFFDYAIQAFRWTFRLGGQPFLSAPVSPAKGSMTKSFFIALAAR
ncbi:MAG TPA: phage major capsid protein [Vicinamibacterales bacterium]|nr:phage major capsid protein [Vicinamibacterales bacterium]